MIGDVAELRAVVIDWGGVLTQPMVNTVRAWIAADQIDWDRYVAVVGPWLADFGPEHCVFVDDVEANVKAAIDCGMTGVHHTEPALTQQRLTELFANR